jgi:hypothetical protein
VLASHARRRFVLDPSAEVEKDTKLGGRGRRAQGRAGPGAAGRGRARPGAAGRTACAVLLDEA